MTENKIMEATTAKMAVLCWLKWKNLYQKLSMLFTFVFWYIISSYIFIHVSKKEKS